MKPKSPIEELIASLRKYKKRRFDGDPKEEAKRVAIVAGLRRLDAWRKRHSL